MRTTTAADLFSLLSRPANELTAFVAHTGIIHTGTVLSVEREDGSGDCFNVRVRPPTGDAYTAFVRTRSED